MKQVTTWEGLVRLVRPPDKQGILTTVSEKRYGVPYVWCHYSQKHLDPEEAKTKAEAAFEEAVKEELGGVIFVNNSLVQLP